MRKKKSRESFTVSITLEKCKVYKYRKCRVVLRGVASMVAEWLRVRILSL
jgi:hypothetical protein